MRLATLLTSFMLSACSTFGIRTVEQPPYAVTAQVGAIEIRSYSERTAAETLVVNGEVAARSEGFRRLARYIFGGNTGQHSIAMTSPAAQSSNGQQIAMTAPVAQADAEGGSWTIRFYLPASVTRSSAPKPLDDTVHIITVPPATMAVLRFSGARDAAAVALQREQLLQGLRASPWEPVGEPVAWFYDPPWTLPPLRRNEVAVEVRRPPA